MQSTLKSTILPLTCLALGMLFFIVLASISIPFTINKIGFALIAIVVLFSLSKVFLNFENISLSVVNLLPNQTTINKLLIGLLTGAIIVGLMLITLFTFTELDLQRIETQSLFPVLISSLVIIPLALMEEILFRGYPFFRLSQILNIRLVIIITAVLFALYHYNGTQNIGIILLGPGIWGVTFGVAAYMSNSIAVPLGIHISANFIQVLFGMKPEYLSIWSIVEETSMNNQNFNHEYLGIAIQILLLVTSFIILELFIRSKSNKQS